MQENDDSSNKIILLNKENASIKSLNVNKDSNVNNLPPQIHAIFNTSQVKTYEIEAKEIKLGSRCLLSDGFRKGEVAYVGLAPELGAGYFVGIKLDEPMGNCDGKYHLFY